MSSANLGSNRDLWCKSDTVTEHGAQVTPSKFLITTIGPVSQISKQRMAVEYIIYVIGRWEKGLESGQCRSGVFPTSMPPLHISSSALVICFQSPLSCLEFEISTFAQYCGGGSLTK